MKQNLLLTAFMLLAAISLKATVHTVSNDANQPAQWNNLQTACDSASAGDTIYVQGTAINYGTIHVKKKLHLIGAGIKPSGNYLFGYPTWINGIILDTVSFISGSSGSIIEGFTFTGGSNYFNKFNLFTGYSNLILRRNRIEGSGYFLCSNGSNILVVNNIIGNSRGLGVDNSTNVIVMNNIFTISIGGANTTTLISNNLFINTGAFSGCQSSTISNNIFYYGNINSIDYSNFSNNLGFGLSSNIVTGTNSGSNNFQADPQFKYIYSTTNHAYNDQNDYNLKTSSAGKNAGTDGTDIGIFGGQYPFPKSVLKDYVHCITPTIPVVEELVIQNSSVPANGNLNFSVKAYKTTK